MNKKLIGLSISLLILLLLGAVGAWWFFLRGSSRVITECLPSNTILYATFPDLTKTAIRYQSSDLKKVLESKEISGLTTLFSAKLWESFQKDFAKEDLDFIEKNLHFKQSPVRGETFLAVTKCDVPTKSFGMIIGSRSAGSREEIQNVLKNSAEFITKKGAKFKQGEGSHQGVTYVWYGEDSAQLKLCIAFFEGWSIVAAGEDTLKEFIDSYKNPASKDQSLKANSDYQFTIQQFNDPQDFLLYINFKEYGKSIQKAFDLAKETAAASPSQANPTQVPSPLPIKPDLSKVQNMMSDYFAIYRGFAIGLRFHGAKIAERWVIPMSDSEFSKKVLSLNEPCDFKSAKFTGYDTLFYAACGMNLKSYWNFMVDTYDSIGIPVKDSTDKMRESLKAIGLDFDQNILDAIGNEFSFDVAWPKDEPFPNAAVYMGLKDVEKFKPTRDFLEKMIPQVAASMGGLTISEKTEGKTKLLSSSIPSRPEITPTLTFDDQFISLQLTEKGTLRSLRREAKESVLSRDALKEAFKKDHPTYNSLIYCDTPTLVDRSYAILRDFALKSPVVTGLCPVPAAQWPEKLSFTPYLGEVCFTARITEQKVMIADAESGIGSQIIPAYSILVGGIVASHLNTQAKTPPPAAPQNP